MKFIINVDSFFLEIPFEYQGYQVNSEEFDRKCAEVGENLGSVLGGDYLYWTEDDDR